MRTARDWKRPPSSWLGGDGSWTPRDDTLTLALTAYEDGLCKQCGHPLVLCRDESYEGWWEAETAFCYASQATEQWRRSKPKDWEPEPGQLVYAALPEVEHAHQNRAEDQRDRAADPN